jgi:hypothetical protein
LKEKVGVLGSVMTDDSQAEPLIGTRQAAALPPLISPSEQVTKRAAERRAEDESVCEAVTFISFVGKFLP